MKFGNFDGILEGSGKVGVVIAHGRNNDMNIPILAGLAKELSKFFVVLRFNYSFNDSIAQFVGCCFVDWLAGQLVGLGDFGWLACCVG